MGRMAAILASAVVLASCAARSAEPTQTAAEVELGARASLALESSGGAELLETPSRLHFGALHDGLVRSASLLVAVRDGAAVVGFDTQVGEVVLVADAQSRIVARRAQLGCMSYDAGGTLWVATLERAAEAPVSELVVRRFAGARLDEQGEAWRPQEPAALSPEPGSRCAFVPSSDGRMALVARAQAAPGALDLWWVPVGDEPAVAFGSGTRVPLVVDSAVLEEGALLVTETVVDDAASGRTRAFGLLHVDGAGARTVLPSGAPFGSPLSVAVEERTAVVSWVEPGRRVPVDFMQPPHVTVLSRVVPRGIDAVSIEAADVLRTDVYDPVSRESSVRPLFAEGRWWALLVPEPHLLRGEQTPAPYRERIVALDEGPATVRLLPEAVHGAQLAGELGLVALGQPSAEHPGFSQGVLATSGPLQVADLEVR